MFGIIIKNLRKERMINQEQLASELNVTQGTISSWEKERTAPSIQQLIDISNYFNCSIDFVVGKTDLENDFRDDSPFAAGLLSELAKMDSREQVQLLKILKIYNKTK